MQPLFLLLPSSPPLLPLLAVASATKTPSLLFPRGFQNELIRNLRPVLRPSAVLDPRLLSHVPASVELEPCCPLVSTVLVIDRLGLAAHRSQINVDSPSSRSRPSGPSPPFREAGEPEDTTERLSVEHRSIYWGSFKQPTPGRPFFLAAVRSTAALRRLGSCAVRCDRCGLGLERAGVESNPEAVNTPFGCLVNFSTLHNFTSPVNLEDSKTLCRRRRYRHRRYYRSYCSDLFRPRQRGTMIADPAFDPPRVYS